MTEQEIPKELELEQNKFVQTLFKSFIELQKENQLLKNQINIASKSQVKNKDYSQEKKVITRTEPITTYRDIRLVNDKNEICCGLCDNAICGTWRQKISLETCNPDCAADLEMVIFKAVNNYKAYKIVKNS